MSTTVEKSEIYRFARDSGHWWDECGPYASLHRVNPARIAFLRDTLKRHFGREEVLDKPLSGIRILDIGCGGGLVSEPLARLGGSVTGLDADASAIAVAQDHAREQFLSIDYRATTAEDVATETPGSFDAVLALEIVEHVRDVPLFVNICATLCKPGGCVVFSTLNRTPKSFALGVVAAEYILRWVPRGTHNWKKFLRPSELARSARSAGLAQLDIKGIVYNPFQQEFVVSDTDLDVNYVMVFTKKQSRAERPGCPDTPARSPASGSRAGAENR
ncbi:MAG: bifunctional 2-polyprenyl-6-hydroxyphenol methylase/3-demethylubiquinol 3-O-methyltransferase UbiG [Alphaproteobacteria bacterium]|nr:bifunctional 2-polyprenyl-6-hydroxyphenol methylase/3-demethylubiquinol 3-O-methyltransferase UbiG [Alphaproteobacteria bacterium]